LAELKNEFSWSKTRDETFQTCPRRYYFQYYGSWGGWDATAPERTRHLYVLKQLVTRHIWVGSVVHDCIERSLKNLSRGIDVLSPEKIIQTTIAGMRDDFRSSRNKNYWKRPKTCAFFEHEYDLPVSAEEWKQAAANVRECLHNFYTSELFATLRSLPRRDWLEIEELDKFPLDETQVWAKIDCSYRDGDGARIIDWKTGRSMREENTLQLVCYALYGHQKWGVPLESIATTECYLLPMRTNDYRVSQGDVEDARAYIRGSVADMHSLLADVTNNEPLAEAAFEKTDSEGTCRRCNFLRLCRPELLPGKLARKACSNSGQ
jgi:CRISPR/Cas system-associated exonuclease Cas4 (RecB family)